MEGFADAEQAEHFLTWYDEQFVADSMLGKDLRLIAQSTLDQYRQEWAEESLDDNGELKDNGG
jgi:hypothetical protein